MEKNEGLMKLSTFAKLVDLTYQTAYQKVRAGLIPHVKLGRRVMIERSYYESLMHKESE